MKSKTLAAIFTLIIVILSVASIALYSQVSGLQSRVSKLETQNSTLQEQLKELQRQNGEQQDRASDLTGQLALERHLKVEISEAFCSRGWYAFGGVTVSYPANVTVVNEDVVPLFGLTATFMFVDKDSGRQIGWERVTDIERLDVKESLVVNGSVLVELNVNVDNAVCKITVAKGSIVIDEVTQDLT
jgi:predicted Holliday junction resolvase-like endonuclease